MIHNKIMSKSHFILTIICIVHAGYAFSSQIDYDGYKIYKLTPHTASHITDLQEMHKQYGAIFINGLSERIGSSCGILLAPHEHKGKFIQTIFETGMTLEEIVPDVKMLIDGQVINNEPLKDGRLSSDRYHTLHDIYEFLETQARIHSSFVSIVNIGLTFEERNLTVLKISKSNETKPAIWIDSNIHAREWITGAVGTYIIDQLLNNGEFGSWLNDYDWYILPIANPDGYSYTFTHDRFWRKTRSNTTSPLGCKGADPNRNFNFEFYADGGSSPDPCSLTYRGPEPFSEPETKAMADFIDTISTRLVFYLSLHSAGQYILIPTGFSNASIPEYDTYEEIGNLAAAAHAARYSTVFTPGNIVNLLYRATGSSMDYVYHTYCKTNLTLTYELRDKGQYGHLLPSNQILPSQEEFMDGFKVIMEKLAEGVYRDESCSLLNNQ